MPPIVDDNFDLPEAIQWLIDITKISGLPGVKPVRDLALNTVSVKQPFKSSQTLGVKYQKCKTMFNSLVAKFELVGGWGSLPTGVSGQYMFVSSNNRICVVLTHQIGSGMHPSENFEIEIRNLKPKSKPII